ncbi:MAG: hypothetical protein KJ990_03960 [Proteobacteria bacterium]|nr:hypothetical protein [Pseudomonadota bacterium]MBU1650312.1 hypothetical protein [Pseudomonadota bacterium]MBU1986300.1 hypothetical protein [Pseudomonadota bacterium]
MNGDEISIIRADIKNEQTSTNCMSKCLTLVTEQKETKTIKASDFIIDVS